MKRSTGILILSAALAASLACSPTRSLVGETNAGVEAAMGGTGGAGGSGAGGTLAMAATGPGWGGTFGGGGTVGTGPGGGGTGQPGTTPDAGADGPPATLSPTELANRLAKLIWNMPPDAALLAQTPQTAADVRALATRMLADPRARVGVGAFYRWWLRLDAVAQLTRDPTQFPTFSTALRDAMAAEPEAFGVNVTLDGDGSYKTLMTASYSMINEPLAAVYGVSGVTGTDLTKVALDPLQRAGVITQPGILALESDGTYQSPSRRGTFILEQFLCQAVPEPPINVPPPGTTIEPLAVGETVRQRLASLTASATVCQACHNFVDNAGFGLGNFDALGTFSTTDNGGAVDASGQLSLVPLQLMDGGAACTSSCPAQITLPYDGPLELAAALAAQEAAQQCFAQQWLAFALGRAVTAADDTSLWDAWTRFSAAQLDIPTLIAAVAATDAFLAP
jgi:hypothetical protein